MSFVSVTTPESGIVRDGLLYWINPSLASSYSGSGTTIYDLSGNDYDSSLQSGAGFSADNGGVFSTNGSSSWIKLEENFLAPAQFNANSHYTISMWFRTVGNGGGMLLGQSNNATIGAATSYIAAIYVGTDGILRTYCLDEPSNGRTTVDISDLRDNKWHNVVVTFAGTGAGAHKTYVDGVLKGSVTKSGNISYSSTYYYTVGGGKATGWVGAMSDNFWFNGNFGDFKYYNRALTDIEVLQNFRAMAPRYGLLYYDILQDDLLFNIDSFYPPSYGGSGTVLTDTVKGLTVDFDGAVATGYGISPYTSPNGWDFNNDATEYVNQNSSDFEFQYGDSFSVEAVVLVNENYNSGYIVSNRQTDASGTQFSGWALIQKDGKIRAAIGGYPSNAYDWRNIDISTTDFTAHVYQKWSHIVWSNDGTTGGSKIYINGVDRTNSVADDATPPYTINYDSDFKLGFAADTASGTAPFNGNISACRIYNKSLSSEEVRHNYNAVANNYGLVPWGQLIIHDAFGGSGTVSGRTPDTVNNGNDWEVSGTSGMRVLSGFMTLGTANNGESRAIVNPNTSKFKIVMKTQALTWSGTAPKPGIVTHYAASPLRRTVIYLEGSSLRRWESHAGGNSSTTLGTYGSPSTNVLDWVIEMDGTSMTYLIKDGATTMYSGTTTNQNSTNTAGYYQQYNNTDLTYCLDFKVYA